MLEDTLTRLKIKVRSGWLEGSGRWCLMLTLMRMLLGSVSVSQAPARVYGSVSPDDTGYTGTVWPSSPAR